MHHMSSSSFKVKGKCSHNGWDRIPSLIKTEKKRFFIHGYYHIVNDVLTNFYHIRSLIFIKSSYWSDIQTIYKNWTSFNQKTRQIEDAIFMSFQIAKRNIFNSENRIFHIPTSANYIRTMDEYNHCLKSYKASKELQTLLPFGYIHSMKANNLFVPDCINQMISEYYASLLFYERIKELIDCAMNGVISFFECHKVKEYYSMIFWIHNSSFYDVYHVKIVDVLNQTLSELSKEYLMNQMNLMQYTKQIEIFMDGAYSEYHLELLCHQFIIPSYVDTNDDDSGYNKMVYELNKTELKRIYKLFNKVNKTEANKLNASYKNKLKNSTKKK